MAQKSEIIIYQTEDNETRIETRLLDETVWLTQQQIAELFFKDKRMISEHVGNIYKECELVRESTVRKFRTVQQEGCRTVERERDHFNLDVIISVSYRVKSHRGTQFRKWATEVCLRFSQTLLHQDLGTFLRKKSLNLVKQRFLSYMMSCFLNCKQHITKSFEA